MLSGLSRPIHLIHFQHLNQRQQTVIRLHLQTYRQPFSTIIESSMKSLFGTVQQLNSLLMQLVIIMTHKPHTVVLSALNELVRPMREVYVICHMRVYHRSLNHLHPQVCHQL